MDVYVTKSFDRWGRKKGVADEFLCNAVDEMERGLVDANLGGGLYKKRVAEPGHGKRGSFRTLVVFRSGDRSYFVYGFAKKERGNIDEYEEKALKKLGKELLGYDNRAVRKAVRAKALRVLRCKDG